MSFLREAVSSPEKLDVAKIARAAKVAQKLVGLSLPGGAAFGLKNRKKINRSGVRYGSTPTVDDVILESGIIENDMLISLHSIDVKSGNPGAVS